jgi:hypothetical protein
MWRLVLTVISLLALSAFASSDEKQTAGAKKIPRRRARRNRKVAEKKAVFVAFAIEDETCRNFLVGQSLNTSTPFEFIDMSVKEPYDEAWKEKVRTRIKRSAGLIALVSKNSLNSSGQKWEIQCALEEKKKILGIWAYKADRTNLAGVNTVEWTWDAISRFIDSL